MSQPGDIAAASGKLARPYWPLGALLPSIACGVIAGLSAPGVDAKTPPPDWFVPFFSTSAGVIAALFVALALGARQVEVSSKMATLTVAYVAFGEVAAVAALSTALPRCAYAWLLGVTVGAGIGALLNSVIVGAAAISAEGAERREARLEEILGRLAPGKDDRRG